MRAGVVQPVELVSVGEVGVLVHLVFAEEADERLGGLERVVGEDFDVEAVEMGLLDKRACTEWMAEKYDLLAT